MPTYTFRNIKTDEVFEKFMSISAREQFLASNPDIITMPAKLNIIAGIDSSSGRNLGGFRDVLKNMKDKHPKSTGLNHLV